MRIFHCEKLNNVLHPPHKQALAENYHRITCHMVHRVTHSARTGDDVADFAVVRLVDVAGDDGVERGERRVLVHEQVVDAVAEHRAVVVDVEHADDDRARVVERRKRAVAHVRYNSNNTA